MMNKMTLLALLVLCPASSFAGMRTRTGREDRFWKQSSVVYADIDCRWDGSSSNVSVTLHVNATLSGPYDAAALPVLNTDLRFGGWATAMLLPPPPKAHAVVVLFRSPDEAFTRPPDQPYSIPQDYFTFMPNWSAFQVVDGFDDPIVSRIITKLRDIRSKKPLSPPDLDRYVEAEAEAKSAEDAKAPPAPGIEELNELMERLRKEYESLGRLTKESSAKKRVQKPSVRQGRGGYNGDISGLDELIERLMKQDESLRPLKKQASPEKPPQKPSAGRDRRGY
jgi:hypothetical protein